MNRRIAAISFILLVLAPAAALAASDEEEARALFAANLDAIRRHDRAAYLACYLESPSLARSGPAGTELGWEPFVKQAGGPWPDVIDASDLFVVGVAPGVVYGSYRYRVRFGADEHAGLSERLFVKTPKGWRIAATTAFESPAGTPPPPRALVGATLLDGRGGPPVKDAVVVLREGKIACAGPRAACPVPPGTASVDLAGKFVTPGLVDAHVHFSQTGWCDGRPDAFDVRDRHPYAEVIGGLERSPDRFLKTYACSGVTAVFDVGGYPWTLGLPDRAALDGAFPRVKAAGPLLSTLDHWLNLPGERQFVPLKDEASARDGVRWLAARGASAVKVWYIVSKDLPVEGSAPFVRAAADEAAKAKLPLIVHATGLAEAKEALRSGAKLLVHGVEDRPVDAEFLDLARKAGAIYCPTLVVVEGYLKLGEAILAHRAPQADDPNGCVDAVTRARLAETARLDAAKLQGQVERRNARMKGLLEAGAANLMRVRDAGIPIAMGTDAGNPLTLHGVSVYAEMEAMQAAGMTPMEVLVASTRGGAAAMGVEKETGTVEAGKSADLLVLDADPSLDAKAFRKLRAVVRGGVLRGIQELRAVASR